MQHFGKSCILYLWRERTRNERSSSSPFCQKSVCVVIYSLDNLGQLPFNKSCSCPQFSRLFLIPLISSLCSTLWPEAHSRLSSLLSALPSPCCYKPLCGKSLSFLLSSVESSSSSSSFFIFFNAHSSVFFLKFYLSNLIWEIHFKGSVLINKTPSNTDLLPKTTRYQH